MLKTFPDDSIDLVVTSPPYYALRSYLKSDDKNKRFEIGTEPTPDEYVQKLVEVFREVKRVLKPQGIFYLNIADCYAGSWGNSGHRPELDNSPSHQRDKNTEYLNRGGWDDRRERPPSSYKLPGLKPKDLMMIPARVALALQADGWYLRSEIVWTKGTSGQKGLTNQIENAAREANISEDQINLLLQNLDLYVGNPMPESIRDRCTSAHEKIFMFAKSKKYFYDCEAVKESCACSNVKSPSYRKNGKSDSRIKDKIDGKPAFGSDGFWKPPSTGRNLRNVWTITTKPFKEAHFASFPVEIPEICIKSGTSECGYCPVCGKPYIRILDRTPMVVTPSPTREERSENGRLRTQVNGTMVSPPTSKTLGWQPTCNCQDSRSDILAPVPAIVLDPFFGAGTTGLVAKKLGRNFVGIELSGPYCKMARKRIDSAESIP